jgi:glutamate carboxypeptidase
VTRPRRPAPYTRPVNESSAPGSPVTDAELRALERTVAAAYPSFLAGLEQLCNIDCGSYSPIGVNHVASWVATAFRDLGGEVDRRKDPDGRYGDTVIGRFAGRPGAGPRILLIGHMDTVFSDGTTAERPFSVEGTIARGAGVSDMKGGLLAGIHALAALRDLGGGNWSDLPFDWITYIANPDEEIGSPSSTPHIREAAANADVCFVLECARANGDFVSSRKGIADLRLAIQGRAAHAGVEPEKGRSAVLAGARIVERIQALNGRWPGVTANVGVFQAGTRPNIVPDKANLEVDVRGVTARELEAAVAAVRAIAGEPGVPDVSVEITQMAGWAPMEKLERSGRLADHVKAIAARLGFSTMDVATGGASDANTTSGMGVPSIDGLGPIGGRDHSPDEYLEVDSIVPRTTLLAALLLATGRDPVVHGWRAGCACPAARTERIGRRAPRRRAPRRRAPRRRAPQPRVRRSLGGPLRLQPGRRRRPGLPRVGHDRCRSGRPGSTSRRCRSAGDRRLREHRLHPGPGRLRPRRRHPDADVRGRPRGYRAGRAGPRPGVRRDPAGGDGRGRRRAHRPDAPRGDRGRCRQGRDRGRFLRIRRARPPGRPRR